jgi:drug/metabolite transporter (DMT)-like permease
MKLSQQRQGELYLVGAVLLWSALPLFIQLSYSGVSPFTSLAVSSLFSALFFAVIVTIRGKWHEITNRQGFIYTLCSTFFVGVIFYPLYFLSLRYSSAGNISILALSEVFFSFLLFHVWKREYIPREHIYGAILVLIGAGVVLVPSMTSFRLGDGLILIGTALVPFSNFFVQKARKLISTEMLMFVRGVLGAGVIYVISILFHSASPLTQVIQSLPYLAVNGLLILGLSTMLWVEGIHRVPVTKANALSAIGPLVTLFFVWIVFKTVPTLWQLSAFIPMSVGVMLISKKIS